MAVLHLLARDRNRLDLDESPCTQVARDTLIPAEMYVFRDKKKHS